MIENSSDLAQSTPLFRNNSCQNRGGLFARNSLMISSGYFQIDHFVKADKADVELPT